MERHDLEIYPVDNVADEIWSQLPGAKSKEKRAARNLTPPLKDEQVCTFVAVSRNA